MALLEKLDDVRFRPSTETGPHVAAQARRVPSVELRAREIVRTAVVERLFLDTDAARGMAGAAMAGALDQIGAAIPRGVMAGLRDIAAIWSEKGIPDRERPAEAEWCRNLTFQICLMDGRHLLQKKSGRAPPRPRRKVWNRTDKASPDRGSRPGDVRLLGTPQSSARRLRRAS